ncbi:Papilin [Apostichopus japonicus]|uniref:Papilin n=1 Tax=Stichopus japonicus TaxID=307972 RepID=A0A2G8K5Z3_STIJA|nr:Papilin [Apostichopus japonicus]
MLSSITGCRNIVYCSVSPCEFATCAAYPEATCVDNYCGGCFTDWFNGDTEVDCDIPTCKLPIELGPCRGAIQRHGFNSTSGECEEFTYGGCLGNANNFETRRDCTDECGCRNIVYCSVSPCDIATCAAYPEATCVDNYCGGCFTDWFIGDTEVDCDIPTCQLPIEPGPCRGAIQRHGFNSTSGECEEFTYGGCLGNANNFETERDCIDECGCRIVNCSVSPCESATCAAYPEATCVDNYCGGCFTDWFNGDTKVDCDIHTCKLPIEPGPCRAAIQRWGFNPKSGVCEKFTYGGCLGNANKFETERNCTDKCGCRNIVYCSFSPCEFATCPAYPEATCVDNYCGGCFTDWFNGVTEVDCDIPTCQLPIEPGPCRGALQRRAFNPKSGKCEEFTYGGCLGNANNFKTERGCIDKCGCRNIVYCSVSPCEIATCAAYPEATCVDNYCGGCFTDWFIGDTEWIVIVIPTCELPIEPGPCRGAIQRRGFNHKTGKCEEFTYGGCLGNANNFETERDCNDECGCRNIVYCSVSPCESATCAAYPEATCVDNYCGGCFTDWFIGDTEVDCDIPTCELPIEPGPCRGAIQRWGFNHKTGKCEEFTYGGCLGNANNFKTERGCTDECGCRNIVYCSVSPCEIATCTAYPEATCVDNYCGGCFTDWFNGVTEVDCDIPTCQLPMEPGPCRGAIQRWGFNPKTGKCEEFTYGGCLGNANNFETERDCTDECGCRNIVYCSVSPCEIATCAAYPEATCVDNYCGGCFADWFNGDTEVDCESK